VFRVEGEKRKGRKCVILRTSLFRATYSYIWCSRFKVEGEKRRRRKGYLMLSCFCLFWVYLFVLSNLIFRVIGLCLRGGKGTDNGDYHILCFCI
jgi:hypothetical protein